MPILATWMRKGRRGGRQWSTDREGRAVRRDLRTAGPRERYGSAKQGATRASDEGEKHGDAFSQMRMTVRQQRLGKLAFVQGMVRDLFKFWRMNWLREKAEIQSCHAAPARCRHPRHSSAECAPVCAGVRWLQYSTGWYPRSGPALATLPESLPPAHCRLRCPAV
jgi:hypothetical protein